MEVGDIPCRFQSNPPYKLQAHDRPSAAGTKVLVGRAKDKESEEIGRPLGAKEESEETDTGDADGQSLDRGGGDGKVER